MDTSAVIALVGIAISIMVNIAVVGRWSGKTSAQITAIQGDIKRLETKQDKHNCLVERMVEVEQRSKSNTHRLDEHDIELRRPTLAAQNRK